jgi:hypothetical protein
LASEQAAVVAAFEVYFVSTDFGWATDFELAIAVVVEAILVDYFVEH